jgi:hypothetical protein
MKLGSIKAGQAKMMSNLISSQRTKMKNLYVTGSAQQKLNILQVYYRPRHEHGGLNAKYNSYTIVQVMTKQKPKEILASSKRKAPREQEKNSLFLQQVPHASFLPLVLI